MLCSRHNGDNKRKTRGRFGDRERGKIMVYLLKSLNTALFITNWFSIKPISFDAYKYIYT